VAVHAVLLDLGDTLLFQSHRPEEKDLHAQVAKRVRPLLRSWGVDKRFDAVSLVRDLYRGIEASESEHREPGYQVDASLVARGALAAHGVDVSTEQAKDFWGATYLGFEAWGFQLYPDTLDTLRRLRSLGIRTGLVSNSWSGAALHVPDLVSLGITEQLLDVFVFSADIGRAKPHPEPFRRALEALAVEPADAVFVGDSLEADMRGGKALDMTTVWKLNGRQRAPATPEVDHTIHDLRELFTLGLLPEISSAPPPPEVRARRAHDKAAPH
jgi:HAD superfamily hydrolase (TIGR01509 family)